MVFLWFFYGFFTNMRCTHYIIVTEGLAYQKIAGIEKCCLSDYFEAVLQQLCHDVEVNSRVFLSPGNRFNCHATEEEMAAAYLQSKRPDLEIFLPVGVSDRPYLDTFDNARLLRQWLEHKNIWPLPDIIIYCNAPHAFRSGAMFQLCGYQIQDIIKCRPAQIERKIVSRLWFYDYPIIQILYEIAALIYNLARWLIWTLNRKFK